MISRAVAIAQRLIRCQSVTPADGGALPLLADLLAAAGFVTHLVPFAEPGQAEVLNLYARIGTEAPVLVFAGHTDVVPPGDSARWSHDPFAGNIAGGRLYGRGACDMKGGVAAFVAAALEVAARNPAPPGSIALLITGDEEGPAVNGTVKLLDWALARGERFDACLVGEPTNPDRLGDMIKNGRRGSLTGDLIVHGRQGHVAYPHLADNPIPHLLRLLDALIAAPLDGGTAFFDPSNLEIVTVDTGNPAANVIPAEARARFNVRFNDIWTPDSLSQEIRRRIDVATHGARISLTFEPCNALAFLTAPGPFTDLVAEVVAEATGRRPILSTSGGTSDARFIAKACPVVEFGLVGKTMHAVNESVEMADIDALAMIYTRIIERFLALA